MRKMGALLLAFTLGIVGTVFADAAADKAKAKEIRAKANKLWSAALENHEKAVKDYEAAMGLQLAADKDAAEARKLYHEAWALDKDARKEYVELAIKAREANIAWLNKAIKSRQDWGKHLDALLAQEEKSLGDVQAALKSETNANNKAGLELTVSSDQDEIKSYQAKIAGNKNVIKEEE